jgi:hypothetical protein
MTSSTHALSYTQARSYSDQIEQSLIFEQQLANGMYSTLATGAAGYFAGHIFNVIDPIGGAFFAITASISQKVLNDVIEKMEISNPMTEIAAIIAAYIIKTGIAVVTVTTIGYPIALSEGLLFNWGVILIKMSTVVLNVLGGAALAIHEDCV